MSLPRCFVPKRVTHITLNPIAFVSCVYLPMNERSLHVGWVLHVIHSSARKRHKGDSEVILMCSQCEASISVPKHACNPQALVAEASSFLLLWKIRRGGGG